MGLVGFAVVAVVLTAEIIWGGLSDLSERSYGEVLKVFVSFSAGEEIGKAYADKNLEINWRRPSLETQEHHLNSIGREKGVVVDFEFWQRRCAKGDPRNNRVCDLYKISGGRMPNILETDVDDAGGINLNIVNDDPRSLGVFRQDVLLKHGFSGRSSVGYGLTSSLQGEGNVNHTGQRNWNAEPSGDQEPSGPLSHIPLGAKIALAALMLAGGVYYLGYAYRYISRVDEGGALLYAFLGAGCMFCGIFFGFQAMLGI